MNATRVKQDEYMAEYDRVTYYARNEAYAEYLAELPMHSYQKYIDHMATMRPGRVLDVGCGTGQVVGALTDKGLQAFGVDTCAPAIEVARKGSGTYELVTGVRLPFTDSSFDSVGCYTVLEHVDEPETMLSEMVRVLKPGGRIVVGCPNFLRVMGVGAHHWHTRGIHRQAINLLSVCRKLIYGRVAPTRLHFDRMEPVLNKARFEPDDDAIIVTNPVDVGHNLRRLGVRIFYQSGLLIEMGPVVDRIGELPVVRTLIGGVFVVGLKQ